MGLNAESPVHNVWKTDLYRMQLEAPSPIPILCARLPQNRPDYLGADYHGEISNKQASELLEQENDGAYLVRNSPSSYGQFYTLSLKFNGKIHHYKLYYDPIKTGLYVREKRYDCVRSLVADGLVTMYLELRAPLLIQHLSTINYNESPYMTLNKRKLRALSREPSRNKRCMTQTKALSSTVSPVESIETIERYEKAHVFKVTTFKGLNWCELCGNFLWGFTAQGVRCEDCGFMAHGKCSERVPNDCIPDIKYIRGVFGIDLTTLLTAHSASIPFVVVMCAKEVEVRGLTTEGIYRLSGFADEIEALKMAFDTDGEKADLSETAYNNINVVAGALKLYLRLLPIPLISFQVHPILMNAIQTKNINEQIKNIAQVLTKLPTAHIKTFQYMMEHLNRVSLHHAINKMNARNLATVFAPTLIGRSTDPTMGPPDLSSDIYLLEVIILHCDKIFQKPLDI